MGRSARVGGGEGGVPFRVGVRLRGPFPIFFLGGRVGGGGLWVEVPVRVRGVGLGDGSGVGWGGGG